MFIRLCCCWLMATMPIQRADAQEFVPRAQPGDSLKSQEGEFRRLFRGINLTADQAALARRIIKDNYHPTRRFLGRPTNLVKDSLSAALDKRDALLLRLLTSHHDRDLFRLNSKEQRGVFVSRPVLIP